MKDGRRIVALGGVFLLIVGILSTRLLILQFEEHEFWEHEALKARTQKISLAAHRGAILDRKGRPLAESTVVHDLVFRFGDFRKDSGLGRVQTILFLLENERSPLSRIAYRGGEVCDWIASFPLVQFRALTPVQRRDDIEWYLGRVLGLRSRDVKKRLRAASDRETIGDVFPDFEGEASSSIQEAVRGLGVLQRRLGEGESLLRQIDAIVEKIDRDVARAMKGQPPENVTFHYERTLHSDLDYRSDRKRWSDVDHELVLQIGLDPSRFPGFDIEESVRRVYPEESADILPSLIGFVKEPGEELLDEADHHRRELSRLRAKEDKTVDETDEMLRLEVYVDEIDYRLGEEQGAFGLERTYEGLLRGKRGWRRVEKDARSRVHRVIDELPPEPGRTITLTLDIDVQRAVNEVLARKDVLLDNETPGLGLALIQIPSGDVLALGAWPSVQRGKWFHHAFRPQYPSPPGSVFKSVVAVAGLLGGILHEGYEVDCYRGIGVGTARFRCLGTHPGVRLDAAMADSCNGYFAQAAVDMGYDALRKVAEELGYGERTGFITNGLVGDFDYHLRRGLKEGQSVHNPEGRPRLLDFRRGRRHMYSFGCGQGFVESCTPIQVARSMGGLALGVLPTLHLVRHVSGLEYKAPPPRRLRYPKDVLERVRRTLVGVVRDGTASREGSWDLSRFGLAGKTGTPETGPSHDKRSNALFGGYLPHDNPKLAVAVIAYDTVDHGGDIARPILDELFSDPRLAPYLGLSD